MATTLNINGTPHPVTAEPEALLLEILREELGLTGAKYGCGEGQCGACTVLVEGKATRSCLSTISSVAGKKLETIEGLAQGETLHPVQQAFLESEALQCGYCTSGMILSALALLRRKPHPTDEEINQAMQGNICRCGTYPQIRTAIRRASEKTP